MRNGSRAALIGLLLTAAALCVADPARAAAPITQQTSYTLDAKGNGTAHDELTLTGDAAQSYRASADANHDGAVDATETAAAVADREARANGPDASTLVDGNPILVHNAEGVAEKLEGDASSNATVIMPLIYRTSGTLGGAENHTWTHVVTSTQDVVLSLGPGLQIVSVENITRKTDCLASVSKAANVTITVTFRVGDGLCAPNVLRTSVFFLNASTTTSYHTRLSQSFYAAAARALRATLDSNKDGFLNESEVNASQERAKKGGLDNPQDPEFTLDGLHMLHQAQTLELDGFANTNTSANDTVTEVVAFDSIVNGTPSATTHTLRRWIENDQNGQWSFTVPPGFAITSSANMTSADGCTATGNATPGQYLVLFSAAPGKCGDALPTPTASASPSATASATITASATPTPNTKPTPGFELPVLVAAVAMIIILRRNAP